MNEVRASEEPLGTPPEIRLGEAWGDFTKALAIYPETNVRVRLNLEKLRAALDEVAARDAGGQSVTLLFQGNDFIVGSNQYGCEGHASLSWLRSRLDHAGLAGVEFKSQVEDAALVGFSQRLLANFLQKQRQPKFDEMWPEAYEGLTLVDRRFVGTFGRRAAGATPAHAASDDASSQPARRSPPPPGAENVAVVDEGAFEPDDGLPLKSSVFLAGLMSDMDVAARLERLHEQVSAGTAVDTEPTYQASDLLEQIIEGLSADSVKDRTALVRSICDVFDGILGSGQTLLDREQEQYATLLKDVSANHFSREGADVERLQAQAGLAGATATATYAGRKRDDAIDGDVESLLEEYARLPARLEINIERHGAESQSEVLSVLLHYVVHMEQVDALRGLYPALSQVLDRPEPEVLAVLKHHLKEAGASGPAGERAAAALIRVLVRVGQGWLLRQSGLLTPENVIASFPTQFGAYLSTLDTAKPEDMNELNDVCERLGHDRVLDAAEALRPALEQMDAGTAAALLDRPDAARLPLARLLLAIRRDVTTAQGASFLRALDLPEPAAFLLYEMPDARHLTPEYLLSLIDHHMGRESTGGLCESVADVLCRHIRETRAGGRTSRARMASIRNLLRFPAPEGWRMLQELRKTTWGFLGANEPLAVRRLAKSISKHYKTA